MPGGVLVIMQYEQLHVLSIIPALRQRR